MSPAQPDQVSVAGGHVKRTPSGPVMTELKGDDLPDTVVTFSFYHLGPRSEAQALTSAGLRAAISVRL